MTDRERNTFQYKDIDIIVENDIESVSGISCLFWEFVTHTFMGTMEKVLTAGETQD